MEFTYPAWANALAKAAEVMKNAGWEEADDDPNEFDKGLESVGLLD